MPRRPQLDFARSPLVAIWETTRACDLVCAHCRASAVPERHPLELSTAEGLALLDQLRDLRPGVVVLTGGDPLKRPDLLDLVRGGVERGLAMALAPSVTPLLTADAIGRLAGAGIGRIALSLDGPDAATHDGLRGRPGAFRATLAAARAARAAGLPVQINTSVGPETVHGLHATGDLVAGLGAALWSVFFVVPVGRAATATALPPETCEAIFHYLYDWGARTGLAVKTTAAPAYRRVFLEREAARRRAGDRSARPRPFGVNDGKGFVFVSHIGDVYPSGFLPLAAGSVRRTHLADLYRRSDLFRGLRDDRRLEGKCGICPFRSVCGGSRARAFAVTGNLFAEDPACAYQPPIA